MKPLIVGLAPHRNAKQPGAFTGSGSSARRLASLVPCPTDELHHWIDAANLSSTPLEYAPLTLWRSLAADLDVSGRVLVACGRIVSQALSGPEEWGQWRKVRDTMITAIPHPSGLCRAWNDPAMQELGERTMRIALALADDPVWNGNRRLEAAV